MIERVLAESIIPSLPGSSFTFVARGLASFGDKIVFAEIGEGRDQLIGMNAIFREAFESAGFECDARFTPHITVLKATGDRDGVPRATYSHLKERRFGEQEVAGISLVSMEGGQHKNLGSFLFSGGSSAGPSARSPPRPQAAAPAAPQQPQPAPGAQAQPAPGPVSSPAPELECPICVESLRPPMRLVQCGAGHIMCDSCFGQVESSFCLTIIALLEGSHFRLPGVQMGRQNARRAGSRSQEGLVNWKRCLDSRKRRL